MKSLRAMQNKKGFTLVELLIVVAIIGILAAIAIPQFAAYRARAFCSAQDSDLANLAVAQEAFFVNNNAYLSAQTITGGAAPSEANTGFMTSPGVTVITTNAAASWTGTALHANCDQDGDGTVGENTNYTGAVAGGDRSSWNSTLGGLQP